MELMKSNNTLIRVCDALSSIKNLRGNENPRVDMIAFERAIPLVIPSRRFLVQSSTLSDSVKLLDTLSILGTDYDRSSGSGMTQELQQGRNLSAISSGECVTICDGLSEL